MKDQNVFKISSMECTLECVEKLKYCSSHLLNYYEHDASADMLAMSSFRIDQCLSSLICLESFLVSFTKRSWR